MKKMYLIGNSHIDPVWLWRWQDGYSEVLASLRSALDRMKETDEFQYTSACAVYYQWIEKTDPEMFEEIRARVKEGRWDLVGGWFLQPDCNLPCGESFARHALVAQRYFKEKFGVTAKSGYNVDSFGHNASLPKLLRGAEMENYVFMRPDRDEKKMESDLFLWKSDDGSTVTAYRIPYRYGIGLETIDLLDVIAGEVEQDGVPRMAFYGIGNHGGGPSAKLIDLIQEKNIPIAEFSTVDRYFGEVEKEGLPIVTGELQHHARGCYSTVSYVKEMNRKCECTLLEAERYALLANRLVGYEYPKKRFRKAWKNLLFNQFHDILAGCSIESAYRDASYLFGETMSIAEQSINGALQAICRKIETGSGSEDSYKLRGRHKFVWEHETLGTPFVIFNPHAYPVRDTVRMRVLATKITDDEGNELPFQLVRGEHTNHDGDNYLTAFSVELPAYGYRVYRAFQTGEAAFVESCLRATAHSLENDCIAVSFDPESGEISKIYDKRTQKVLVEGGMSAILTDETACDTWAHGQFDLGEEVGRFGNAEFTVVENGAVCVSLRVRSSCSESVLTRYYTLYAGDDSIHVSAEVDFREHHRAFKLGFPAKKSVLCEIPYGVIERELVKGEEPFGKWFASNGICVANTGKYGYDSTENQVRMTVLRGAVFADHFGTRDDRCPYMDQGYHKFTYQIFPYRSKLDAQRRAELLNTPPRCVNETFHHGPLGERFEGIAHETDNVMVTAIKMAEDHDGAVVRALETDGKETDVTLSLFGRSLSFPISAYAVETVNEEGEKLNFMEWEKQP